MNSPSQTLELGIIPQWKANRNPAWFRVVTDGVGRLILRREDAKIQTQGHPGVQRGIDRDRGLAFSIRCKVTRDIPLASRTLPTTPRSSCVFPTVSFWPC